jgi:hypothetical protein
MCSRSLAPVPPHPTLPPQRPPAKRGPAVVSLAFTGLSLTPLLALLAYLGYLGVNVKVGGSV